MSSKKEIDWDKIKDMLPIEKTPEQKEKRKDLFDSFDPNGNGYLSLAEVDRGLNMIGLLELFNCKKVRRISITTTSPMWSHIFKFILFHR